MLDVSRPVFPPRMLLDRSFVRHHDLRIQSCSVLDTPSCPATAQPHLCRHRGAAIPRVHPNKHGNVTRTLYAVEEHSVHVAKCDESCLALIYVLTQRGAAIAAGRHGCKHTFTNIPRRRNDSISVLCVHMPVHGINIQHVHSWLAWGHLHVHSA